MIKPLNPCSPDCPGHLASNACKACWASEVLTPTDAYYARYAACVTEPTKED